MINGIVGLMNSGKTLVQTYRLFLDYARGKDILTNYYVNFPHKRINKDFLIWLSQREENLLNVSMGLDELWIWLDSRQAQKNTFATYIFNQSSKTDMNIYFTAQHNGQIDKRIRMNMHKVTHCNRVLNVNGKFKAIDEEQRFLSIEQQKQLYIKAVDFKRVNISFYSQLVPQKPFYLKAEPIFSLYSTRERVLKQ